MLENILTPQQEELLKQERTWLSDLQVILARLGAVEDDHITLKQSIQQLDELFLLVVVGEFNAGKSSFINALLGETILKEGVTPTTAQVNILRYGETSQRKVLEPHLHVLAEPVDVLKRLNIVDTPGTNAIIREHQAITEEFVPRSDLVLFITSADRPYTESERQFMDQIRNWGKKVVIVINKIDLFEAEDEQAQVIGFVRQNVQELLKVDTEIFAVSARKALRAKKGNPKLWEESQFEALENYILDVLDETSRLRLKFLNPLGVGESLLKKYLDITNNRLALLADDFQVIEDIESQLQLYESDMQRDFKYRLADIENILYDMERRGHEFFEENLRMARIPDLMNKERIQRDFETQVVADTPRLIEERVSEMIDWLVNADFNQWQSITGYLEQRKEQYKERIVGDVGSSFRYDREHLIDSVGRTAQRVVDGYDKNYEAEEIARKAQQAVMQSAGLQVGALGLGATVLAVASTTAVDITGILAAGTIAAIGLFVIPAKRRTAQRDLTEKVAELRRNLMSSLTNQFDKELRRSVSRIQDAIAPYTRFVRAERGKLEDTKTELTSAQKTQSHLRAEIEELTKN